MPTFTPVDFDPFAEPPSGGVQTVPGQNGTPTRVIMDMSQSSGRPKLVPVDHDPFSEPSMAADIAKSAGVGVAKGALGIAGMAGDLRSYLSLGVDAAAQKLGIAPERVQSFKDAIYEGMTRASAPTSMLANAPTTSDLQGQVEKVTGPFYKPQTTAGEYAQTAGEFLPAAFGGETSWLARGARVLAPATASETAGQVTKGRDIEPVARFLGALAGGGMAAAAERPGSAARSISNQLPEGVTPKMVDQAEALMAQARQQGIDLSWPEALSQVAGRPVLTNTMRHLEASPQTEAQMAEFFGRRPQQVEQAARGQFDQFSPINPAPSTIGPDVSSVAQQVMRASPEARILDDVLWRAGPRVTPEGAGNVIQGELNNVYRGREGMRAALAEKDYGAARNAEATIPLNGGHRIADVTKHYLDRPNIPIILDDAERAAARAQWLVDNNPTSKMPIVGERATEFGQVDASAVLRQLDGALDTAKGAVRQGLKAARSALFKPDGTLDMSVAGLHNSREAINDLISQAKQAGAKHTVLRLQDTKNALDRALEQVPAYGDARRNFQAASRPLEPFDQSRVPGKIIERDEFNSRFMMPPERVPGTIQNNGPSAAREFNSVASPAAREAFEQHIVTQVLDRATREGADLSADGIRSAIRQNEDLLRQYPGVRDRLESVAIARDGLARLGNTPIGKLAQRDLTTKQAVDALFPKNPLPHSEIEIAETVGKLAERKPRVAADLVRVHVESTFNQAAKDLQTGANQAGGAKFRTQLIANPQARANLQAAVEALPNGAERWQGFNKFLDILEATGTRQGVGSRTTYNDMINEMQKAGGVVQTGAKVVAQPLSFLRPLADKYEQWKLGKNLSGAARILTDPRSANMLRALVRTRDGRRSAALAVRLLTYADASRAQ